jgi:hypothetical protein
MSHFIASIMIAIKVLGIKVKYIPREYTGLIKLVYVGVKKVIKDKHNHCHAKWPMARYKILPILHEHFMGCKQQDDLQYMVTD